MRKKESEWKRQLPGGGPDFEVRTDLAVEEGERFPGDGGEISGVSLRKWRESNSDICMTEVKILNEHGAGIMGKPVGTYLTLEADALAKQDESYHEEVSGELAGCLRALIRQLTGKKESELKILSVGLGNEDVTHPCPHEGQPFLKRHPRCPGFLKTSGNRQCLRHPGAVIHQLSAHRGGPRQSLRPS